MPLLECATIQRILCLQDRTAVNSDTEIALRSLLDSVFRDESLGNFVYLHLPHKDDDSLGGPPLFNTAIQN